MLSGGPSTIFAADMRPIVSFRLKDILNEQALENEDICNPATELQHTEVRVDDAQCLDLQHISVDAEAHL